MAAEAVLTMTMRSRYSKGSNFLSWLGFGPLTVSILCLWFYSSLKCGKGKIRQFDPASVTAEFEVWICRNYGKTVRVNRSDNGIKGCKYFLQSAYSKHTVLKKKKCVQPNMTVNTSCQHWEDGQKTTFLCSQELRQTEKQAHKHKLFSVWHQYSFITYIGWTCAVSIPFTYDVILVF